MSNIFKEMPCKVKGFKQWRLMGQKFLGAVMLGLIEYLIRRRSTLLEKEILSISSSNRQLIDIIKASSNREGQQRVNYVYSELAVMDKTNNNANELAIAYLQKKGVQPTSMEASMKCLATNFNVGIQLNFSSSSPTYGQPLSLLFYEQEKNFYFILQLANLCMNCSKGEELTKLKCDHFICRTCLDQFFKTSKISSAKCQEYGCVYNLTKELYQEIVNKGKQEGQIITECICNFCEAKQNKENVYTLLNCSHVYCKSCVNKHISKSETCLTIQCPGKFKKQDLIEIRQSQPISKSSVQIQPQQQQQVEQINREEQKKSQIQTQKEFPCNLCDGKYQKENILHLSCRHNLCKPCVIKQLDLTKQEICLIQNCSGKFVKEDLIEIRRSLSYSEKNQSKIVEQNIQQQPEQMNDQRNSQSEQQTEQDDELSSVQGRKCSKCKEKGFSAIYKSNCGHFYCQECIEIQYQRYVSFLCLAYGCGNNIKEGSMTFIGNQEQKIVKQKVQKELPPQKCARCFNKFSVQELFYTHCSHFICLSCIEFQANRKTLQCPYCKSRLNESAVEDFYLEQQTQLIKKISQDEQIPQEVHEQFENANECECCHSPFTEYNIQQDVTCHNHAIGTCCIVFPVDCPKCQLGSITVHKSRLKFEFQQYKMEEKFTN